MHIEGRVILTRLKAKNRGNNRLSKAIDQLIMDLESASIRSIDDFRARRTDAEKVHSDGFYFVNIAFHRALVLLHFEDNEVTVVWAGSHQDYERLFKNNRNSIEKWLRNNNLLE